VLEGMISTIGFPSTKDSAATINGISSLKLCLCQGATAASIDSNMLTLDVEVNRIRRRRGGVDEDVASVL
jgi:hypothetical protein